MKELDKNLKRKYSFSDYDPNWVIKFALIKEHLSHVFNKKALAIEHIGSTSIPNMKAKPIIDVLVIVERMENFAEEKQKMIDADYEWGEDYIAPDTLIFFKAGAGGEKFENIHVCQKDAPKVRQFIVKRDFFRAFPDKAKVYADLKEKNFREHPNDYPAYRAAKVGFLDKIEEEAYRWQGSQT